MKTNNYSPYTRFKYWLLDNDDNSVLDEDIIKSVNKLSILAMFGNMGEITLYLNSNYNNYELMYLDDVEFYKFLKSMIKNKNYNFSNFTFFDLRKEKNKYKKIIHQYPYIKKYEAELIIKKYDDEHVMKDFNENKRKEKIKKLTKKELKYYGS